MERSEAGPLRPVTRCWVDASGVARLWVDPMIDEALGYRHKKRTLQQIVQSTRKEHAELIGYNEEPVSVHNEVLSHELKKTLPNLSQHLEETPSKSSRNPEATPSKLSQTSEATPSKLSCASTLVEDSEATVSKLSQDLEKMPFKLSVRKKVDNSRTAKMHLYEICATNHWERPSFELCKEEGPSHQKMFTFKVIVKVEGICSTDLECFGEPKQQKKAAQEDAAAGAIWYLGHVGCLPKS